MSIENITARILEDARGKVEAILKESDSSAKELLQTARTKAEELVKKAQVRGEEESAKQVNSRHSVAVIDGKNLELNYKQQLITECFDKAVEKITSMPEADYLQYLTGIVQASGMTKGELILSASDAKLADGLLGKIKEVIPSGEFSISDEKKDIRGGLMIRQGNTYYNASIEAVSDAIESELVQEVADILFGGQEK